MSTHLNKKISSLEKELSGFNHKNPELNQGNPAYDKTKMLQTIEKSKKEYRKQMLSEPMNSWEFLFQQMLYLSKRYWLTQLIVFFAAAWVRVYKPT